MSDETAESAPEITELRLLEQLACRRQTVRDAAQELVAFYLATDRASDAVAFVDGLLTESRDHGEYAEISLWLGVVHERTGDYGAAAAAYMAGRALEPADRAIWYYLNNNLGYCLNHLGRYAEAEACCRLAIQVDSARHNAHKNLGLALDGRGRYAEAVRAHIEATRLCPEDPRSHRHLEDLIARHPELLPVATARPAAPSVAPEDT